MENNIISFKRKKKQKEAETFNFIKDLDELVKVNEKKEEEKKKYRKYFNGRVLKMWKMK
jgi:hypothetical protein